MSANELKQLLANMLADGDDEDKVRELQTDLENELPNETHATLKNRRGFEPRRFNQSAIDTRTMT